jgi:UDP-2,4-diacetamido-2,4,6-trideoxy-beta-L-altropyranose hydrolase
LRTEVEKVADLLIEIPDTVSLRDEPAFLVRAGATEGLSGAIIDHYAIRAQWHAAARRWARVVAAIDDLASARLDVDIVLNQNLGESADRYDGLVPPSCLRLIGPKYALLRQEFNAARTRSLRVRSSVDRVLVFLSGSDMPDATRLAAEAVVECEMTADVVVGAAYPYFGQLSHWAAAHPRIQLRRNVPNMAELMAEADLSIGAPGSASWERCAVVLPTILITLAPNQVRAAAAIEEAGAGLLLGWASQLTVGDVAGALRRLVNSPDTVARMSQAATGITDGLGATRVADELDGVLRGRG